MGAKFSAYASYKPVDLGWLTEIPCHWEIKRLKYLGEAIIGLTYSPDDVVDENEGTLVLRSSNVQQARLSFDDNVYVNKSIPEKLRTKKGDILICARNGSRALIGKNAQIDEASAGLSFGAFMSIFRSRYNNYLSKVFNSALFEYQSGSFLTATINQLTTGNLNSFEIPLPTESERELIANFLDHETAKIDTLIEKQQQLIQLLKEKRQAVISHAVTKGLNSNAPMKDSGVEWLGEVPEHWEVARLKNVLKINNGRDYKDVEVEDGGYPVYGSGGIFKRSSSFLFDGKSVLFGRKGTVDKPLLVSGKFWTVDTMFYSEIFNLCIPEFIHYQSMQFPFDLLSTSTALPSMTQEALLSLGFVYPSKKEQNKIIEFIQIELNKMDAVICKANDAIQLMQERRTALISAAVTGKIDVRHFVVEEGQAAKAQAVV
jgi:type I restriction enzyme S subunit